ncbi:hypothetical protein [Testudinibacter sp. TR-2022]|uniref:hypothetical protein n=1 Tax=Testudinibacter sp. TR-2022 TaxID=2585029 RepID=UPI001118A003|nr:hypothetical protein [Testudinibacter sp. TR-2022]TNH06616.1 hypothetical protein FHQ30_07155 [Pasteurellaceae bacterium Phil11]TNH25545.1 hypothetical protein FHQ29_01370 [Testudinibacter sp. TR-2022]TNH25675.1 hypothetical protein FHQ27_08725 [Testudinibacter sp. TR-2022]
MSYGIEVFGQNLNFNAYLKSGKIIKEIVVGNHRGTLSFALPTMSNTYGTLTYLFVPLYQQWSLVPPRTPKIWFTNRSHINVSWEDIPYYMDEGIPPDWRERLFGSASAQGTNQGGILMVIAL